jgi:heterodisulfide reductase subunit A-like polyferredoxin
LYPVEYRRRAGEPVGEPSPPAVVIRSERLTTSEAWREVPAKGLSVNTDVLIVGGGLAGIYLANQLKNAGRDYVLIEARPRLGGRI